MADTRKDKIMNTEAVRTLASTASPTDSIGHFINGEMVGVAGRSQAVYNPATGAVVREVALASNATVQDAMG